MPVACRGWNRSRKKQPGWEGCRNPNKNDKHGRGISWMGRGRFASCSCESCNICWTVYQLVPLHKGRNFSICSFSNQCACLRVTASAQSKALKMIKVNFQLYIKTLLLTKEWTPQGGKPRHPGHSVPTVNTPDCPQQGGQDNSFFAEPYCEPPSISS